MKIISAFALTTAVALAPSAAGQYSLSTLYTFTDDDPVSLVAAQGSLFGVLQGAGVGSGPGCGGVFKMQPPGQPGAPWTETTLYSFSFSASEPCTLIGDPVVAPDGSVYGLSAKGGTYGGGTLYKLTPPAPGGAWSLAVLYDFAPPGTYNAPSGSGLIPGPGGTFYLLASDGGEYGFGALVQLWPPAAPGEAWSASILFSFPVGTHVSSIISGPGGVFYGTAMPYEAIQRQYGQVFELAPPSSVGGAWSLTVVYTFPGREGDPGNPNSLTLARDGTLYGTTYGQNQEGTGGGHGGIFSLTPPSSPGGEWTFTLLRDFFPDHPDTPLILRDGNLYGALSSGNYAESGGAVFELEPPSVPGGEWTTVILHEFGNDQSPINSLILRPDGTFYGITADIYSTPGIGTVYSLKPE
jgi:hypothetical protein